MQNSFSVAKNFIMNLGTMTPRRYLLDLLNSIEGEPDR